MSSSNVIAWGSTCWRYQRSKAQLGYCPISSNAKILLFNSLLKDASKVSNKYFLHEIELQPQYTSIEFTVKNRKENRRKTHTFQFNFYWLFPFYMQTKMLDHVLHFYPTHNCYFICSFDVCIYAKSDKSLTNPAGSLFLTQNSPFN